MKDKGRIIIGIFIFAGLFTIPLWMNLSSGTKAEQPVLEYPEGYDQCIESKEYMKAFHMDILNDWRDKVVREDIRFTTVNGVKTEMSLSKTCMKCHSDKTTFCDKCHDYLGVVPYCWDCHIMPQEVDESAVQFEDDLYREKADENAEDAPTEADDEQVEEETK